METGLGNKTVCITGGSSGIGLATARAFLAEGCRVAICGRNGAALEAAVEALCAPGRVRAWVADVTDGAAMRRFADEAAAAWDGVDVWVNNAGISRAGTIAACGEEDWHALIDVNITGVWNACRAAIPHLQKNGGSIINISSYASLVPTAGLGAYAMSKSAVNVLTRTLAAELCGCGIRVNGVAPGMTWTRMAQRMARELRDQGVSEEEIRAREARRVAAILMARFAQPEEIADAVVFLASDRAGYITGETIAVTGGKGIVQNPAFGREAEEGGAYAR